MSPALYENRKGVERKGGMRILIAAGGSGGHIFPAIALAGALRKESPGCEVRFVGSNKSLDRRLFDKEGLRYWLLSANKLPYKVSLSLIPFFFKLAVDCLRALYIVLAYRPDRVVGFGGYVSFPVVFAAYLFRIPSIVHEQNVVPGRANKLLFRFAGKVAVTFDDTKKFLTGSSGGKAVVTGNPIRKEIFKEDRSFGIERFGLSKDKFTILVIGGSQGAHVLNKTFVQAISLLDEKMRSTLQVIHLTGVKDYEPMLRSYHRLEAFEYRVHSFMDRIEEAYSASDLVVTRAGSSALFEAALFGRPMILIPYPFAMSHQAENAHVFSRNGAAIEIDEKVLTPDIFSRTISGLLKDPQKIKKLSEEAKHLSRPDAAMDLAREVVKLEKE